MSSSRSTSPGLVAFASSAATRWKAFLLCAATGGGCTYAGKDMKTAHASMGINNADWDALVGDLGKSLNKFKVKKADQKALVALLAPMKKDIVEKP